METREAGALHSNRLDSGMPTGNNFHHTSDAEPDKNRTKKIAKLRRRLANAIRDHLSTTEHGNYHSTGIAATIRSYDLDRPSVRSAEGRNT
jgi:hypothetical protein